MRILWGFGRFFFKLSFRNSFKYRNFILSVFGAKLGNSVHIYSSCAVYYPWNLEVGDYSSIGEWVTIYNIGKIVIGERSTISHLSHLCSGSHDYTNPTLPLLRNQITIGSECWICSSALICPNVTISDRAIVGAGSVCTKDVEQDFIVAGNPAKFVKKRIIND